MLLRNASRFALMTVAASSLMMLGGCLAVGNDFPMRTALVEIPHEDDWLDVDTASEPERHQDPAARKIEDLGAEAVAVLNDATLSREAREQRFRAMLARDLDIPVLARFMLGRHWKNTPPEKREAYMEAFSGYVINRYASLLGGATEITRFRIDGVKSLAKGDKLVDSRIDRNGKNPILASWRMREREGRMVIIDLMVEGFSMAQTQRQEFSAILRANDGRIEDLITALREDSA